ncbi:nose resistant to fluoxetine protein 6-like [Diabrotica virgifera virgifera]|uniref:Nose resistant-to-fluoxetine protein N-terminal domain-containing protein n=1 Tax=Diabrotica virgifera virgifera TaxID=50390 RepID=A0ABM5KSY1_DIAVI|nr:nose resistant to fluoxetine protein 6-like [Diabrotica virgifera virgifera]
MARKNVKFLFGLIVLFFIQCQVLHSDAKTLNQPYKFLLNILKNKFNEVLQAVKNSDHQCARDLKRLFNDFIHMERWALEMVDASAKIPSGILAGNVHFTGSFDQCLNINFVKNETNIHGQYCTVVITPSIRTTLDEDYFSMGKIKNFLGIKTSENTEEFLKFIKMTYGICIPRTCSINNLQSIWNYIENTFYTPIRVNFYDTMCTTKFKKVYPLFTDFYVGLAFLAYFGVILLSTWYDICIHQPTQGDEDNLLVSFSLNSNIKKIWRVRDVKKEDAYLESICGIKVITMLWVCLGHRVFLNFVSGVSNLLQMHSEWKHELFTAFIVSGSFAVDTFLMLSGLLISFGIMSVYYIYDYKKFPIIPFYIYRLLRLWPGLIALILFYVSFYKNISEGPLWPLMAGNMVRSCNRAWFPTLFFFNNYIPFGFQCVDQAWYLAVDSQLFFLSPIIIIGLLRNPFKTCLTCIGVCILSGIYTFCITLNYHLGSSFFEFNLHFQQHIYMSTIVRLPAWFIGIIFGYIIFEYRNTKIPKAARLFAWTLVFTIISGVILVHLVFMRSDEYNALNSAVFNACVRQLWALAIALTVLLCRTDREGLINNFLSLPIFQRLVRISYSVFLTHLAVICYFIGSKKQSTYFRNISNVHDFAGDLCFVLIVASIWCILFESPFIAIAKFFYKQEIFSKVVKAVTENGKLKTKINIKKLLLCVYEVDNQKLD